jgi:hypothetical protein
MSSQVILQFPHDVEIVLNVQQAAVADSAQRALGIEWLDRAFIEYECEPLRPSGKVLAVDKVIAVAAAAGASAFQDASVWSSEYALATIQALQRSPVRVDVGQLIVSY